MIEPSTDWLHKFAWWPTLAGVDEKGKEVVVWLDWYETRSVSKDVTGFMDFSIKTYRRLSGVEGSEILVNRYYEVNDFV